MLEINEDKFKFIAFGQELEIRYPTGDEMDLANEKLNSAENKGREIKTMREIFLSLGMPEEVVSRLTINHYNAIFEALIGKKN